MKQRLQTMASPGVQAPSAFIQAILEKYGIRRWKRQLPGLILRQWLWPFAEPEAAQPADTVIQQFHSAIYHPVTRIREEAGPASRLLLVTQGVVAPGTSSRNARAGSGERLQRVVLPAAERLGSLHEFQAEVRKRQGREHLVTTVQRTIGPAGSTEQPPDAAAVEAGQVRMAAVPQPAVPPLPSGAAAAGENAERPGGASAPVNSREQAYAARRQQQVLRAYSLHREAAAGHDRSAGRQPATPAALAAPGAAGAREPLSGAAPGGRRTAMVQRQQPPDLSMRADFSAPQASAPGSPGLRLVLAQQLAAALEHPPAAGILVPPEAMQGNSHPLLPVSAASQPRLLPAQRMQALPPPLRMRQPLGLLPPTAASPALARHGASLRSAGAGQPAAPEERPAAAPEGGPVYTAARRPSPAARPAGRHQGLRHSAGLVPEAELPPAGSASRLVLRKPEAAQASLPEPVQQQLQRMLQEPPPPPVRADAKAAPAAAPMDAAALNRLAEQVYQVLEKRIAIRKDRRGLR
ncbi:hypothetical protein MHI24_03880 [Paenibacillus sp. FSL K6-1096]|uniref:hypothetical protein n=1 Tax=Paenibacillus sp. FSL K6-1096 TaxID=2921460 RepID=UPI0030EF067A